MTTKRLALAMLALGLPAAHAAERFAGDAMPRGGGPVLYREIHYVDGPRQVVSYQCPDGTPFARKLLQSGSDPVRPDMSYEDARESFHESVRAVGNQIEIRVKRAGAAEEARTIDVPKGAVIDAGFDTYIRSHWDALDAGVSVPYLVPSRFRFYDVKITGGKTTQGQRHLAMKLDAWYAFAAPTIAMAYGAGDHRILRYEGKGTVRNASGKSSDVSIDFPPSGRTMDLPASALDDALKAPLATKCPS
ncbi:hypothetical protein L2Y96_09475 [Luteibacter aegosomaticola]|uniref:hypothetical protein n=1 Tax=Luteibacter aegosomaticola TaxID=2911538 RepID=UPI001FFC16EA|nr:hypothetical protein [Luteibacter aegosomaticola]UPG91974.1 hypothetical protein L2Y96_09475 [Luteibacter aegosomaticola]